MMVLPSKRVIVIGAGWSGIAAAVTYLKVDPSIDLTIIDSDSSFGGTWSQDRIYPHLLADSPNSMLEYSDMTMVDDEHPAFFKVSGQQVHDYLDRYAGKYDLHRRARFNTTVTRVSRQGSGWMIETTEGKSFSCDKLIVAYGQTSKENIPDIPNDGYAGFHMHSKDLGRNLDQLSTDSIHDVVVLGAGKSSAECCIAALNAGKHVHLVIRESGTGPQELCYRRDEDYKTLGRLIFTKLFNQLTPSIYNRRGFWYSLLHSGNRLGQWFVVNLVDKLPLPYPDFDANDNIRKLKPKHTGFFWDHAGGMIALYEDSIFFRALETSQLRVHIGDAKQLRTRTLDLSNGEEVPADAIIYATGWNQHLAPNIFDLAERENLGLPLPLENQSSEYRAHWKSLDDLANEEISAMFPVLTSPPPFKKSQPTHTTQRLFRQIVSPNLLAKGDRSITFVGFAISIQSAVQAELYALWAVAWMEGLHPPTSPVESLTLPDLEHEVALENAWMHQRRPADGPRGNYAYTTEIITFWDQVMRDLGLKVDRQQKGWFGWLKEWFVPYNAGCYRDALDELLVNARLGRGGDPGFPTIH